MEDPAVFVSTIDGLATRSATPVAGGSIVWRSWGAGPPLVLLHGASGSWTHWIRNVRALAECFRVHVPDMPGFGDSDAPPEPHTADGLADRMAAGLDVVLPPPAELDLVGFSFGGIVAGLVAARMGRRIRRLVLIAAGGLGIGPLGVRTLRPVDSTMTSEEIRAAHRENLRRLMLGRPESADDLAVALHVENLRRSRFKSGTIPQSDVLRRALPAIRAPITAIWGERDAFFGARLPECRRVLASAQGHLDARVIAGAGHWVPYEAADQVNAELLEVLARRPG